jgi:uncharacterized protein DUF1236
MKTTIGLAIALMLGGTGAYAQGAPGEKMQGAPGMHEQGPGDAGVRDGGPGPDAQQRAEPRSEQRGEPQPSAKGDRNGGKQAQENKEDKSSKGRADKGDQPARAEKQDKSTKTQERAEDRSRTDKDKASQTTEERKSATDRDQSAEKKNTDRTGETSKQATTGDHKEDAKRVDLSGDKQSRIKSAFQAKGDVKHRTNVNIDLRVGTRLPRDWDFVPVPDDVIVIVPEYRGYRVAYVDDYYVICDPDTYEVVAVIPVSGGPSYAIDDSRGRCPERLSLNNDERAMIVHAIDRESREHRVDVPHLTVGWSVPRDIELQKFPEPVVSRVSELSSCRYFVAEDKIAVVSPDEEKVVLLIDRS